MIHIQPIIDHDSWCSTYGAPHISLLQGMRALLFRLDVLARRHSNFSTFLSHAKAEHLMIHGYTNEKGEQVMLGYCTQDAKGGYTEVKMRFV